MTAILKSQIVSALVENKPIQSLHEVLVSFRDSGGTKDDAYTSLNELREEFQGESEDKILELMDFVTGSCSPHMKVWF